MTKTTKKKEPNNYWVERQQRAEEAITKKSVKETEKKVKEYYARTMKSVLNEFENTYLKLLETAEAGRAFTPADLYKLDKYWQMQSQITKELEALGNKEITLLSKNFMKQFSSIYEEFALKTHLSFGKIDKGLVEQMINHIWVADGKSWSKRIWVNIEKLRATLDEGLIECVVTGKKTTQLKQVLMERFNVSYSNAKAIVNTEMAHIQTVAAAKRYEDYGLDEYEILGNDDDSCGNSGIDCHKLNGKKFKYSEMKVGKNAPPFHPNCKCSIIPVIK